jgi:uncharacterized membrane protein YkoI
MRQYYANFDANNGTTLMATLKSTNKNDLMKSIRKMAEDECFDNNTSSWWVEDSDGRIVYNGDVRKRNGKTFYVRFN